MRYAPKVAFAGDGERIVGFAALDSARAEISSVFVDPCFHGSGVGRALVDELENVARADGLAEVTLRATGTAIVFYRKIGYATAEGCDTEPSWALMTKAL